MTRLRDFLTLGSLATVASVIGIGAGVNSLVGHHGGGSNTGAGGNTPPVYVPTGQGGADDTWQQLMRLMTGGATGAQGAMNPALLQAFQQLMGIPTQGLADAGRQAGAYAGNAAANADQIQQQFTREGANMYNAGNQIWQTALDPQNKLRDSLQQQVTDASRAGTSARGIGMSGNAAGIENQDVSKFLMDWQNQQLQRQATGLQAMGQANAQGGRDATAGFDITTMIPQMLMMSGQLPYQGATAAAGAPFNYANMFSQAQGGANNLSGDIMRQIIPYLNFGTGATNSAFGQNQANLGNLFGAMSSMGGGGSGGMGGIQNLINMFTPTGGGSGGTGYNPGGYTDAGFPEP